MRPSRPRRARPPMALWITVWSVHTGRSVASTFDVAHWPMAIHRITRATDIATSARDNHQSYFLATTSDNATHTRTRRIYD